MYIVNKSILCLVIVLIGCKSTSEIKVAKLGSDRDKHGCIHSAGYTWSEINKTCLRPFELKNQLYNVDKTYIASVNFSNDRENAEIFSKEGYFLMKKKNDSTFVHPKAILMLDKNNWIFSFKKNKIEYKSLKDH